MSLARERRPRPDPDQLRWVNVMLHGVRSKVWIADRLIGTFRAALPPEVRFGFGRINGAAWRVGAEDELAGAVQGIELRVAQEAPELIFVHAGAVVLDGRAMLLPGRSGAGKSTLVAELVRQGASYFSDEFAPITADGRVVPFARPLRWHGDTEMVAPAGARPPSGSAARPQPVALVASLRYDPALPASWAPSWSAQSPAAGMLSLIDNTVVARARPGQMVAHLGAAMRSAHSLSGPRGPAEPTACALLELLRAVEPDL